MLSQVLAEAGIATTVFSSKLLSAESVEQAVALAPAIVCISAVPSVSTIAARALCKRLRGRLPSARILIGLWQPEDAEFIARRERLSKVGADETYPDLRRAAAGVSQFAACTPSRATAPGADTSMTKLTYRRPTSNITPLCGKCGAIRAGKPALSRSS